MIGVGMALMQDVPASWRDEVSVDVAAWIADGWRSNDRGAKMQTDGIWTCNQHIVLQTFWSIGAVLPWIDTPGLAYWSGVLHSPRASDSPSLLMLRSPFWRMPAGLVLRSLMLHLFAGGA